MANMLRSFYGSLLWYNNPVGKSPISFIQKSCSNDLSISMMLPKQQTPLLSNQYNSFRKKNNCWPTRYANSRERYIQKYAFTEIKGLVRSSDQQIERVTGISSNTIQKAW